MLRDICLSLLAAALASPSFAQTEGESQETPKDDRIVVTATRNPLPVRELGATVTILQREDFETSGAQTVADALRGLPGISMRRNGGAGSNAEILIRGDKGGHTMIMIDGVEQADVSTIEKNFDIGDMPLHDVERIEIVKGPHSVAYGASGLSGLIHIITKRPQNGVGGNAGFEVGSYDSYGAHAGLSGRQGIIGYAATVSGTRTGGYSNNGSRDHGEADSFERKDGSLRLQYGSGEAYSADLFIKAAQSTADLDAGASVDDPNFQVKRKDLTTQLTQKLRFAEKYETRLAAGVTQSDRHFSDDRDPNNPERDQTWDRSRYQGERRSVDLSQSIKIAPDQTAILSAQWLRDSAEISGMGSYQYYDSVANDGSYQVGDYTNDLTEQRIKEFSYGAQYQWGLWDRVHGQAGVRTLDNSSFGRKTVGQAAFNILLVPDSTTLRLNYGRGFKTPSLYQLRSPANGNAELRPESVISAEGGLEQQFGHGVSATVTGFQNQTENLIEFDSATSRYYNINRGLIKGVETQIAWQVSDELSTQAQYTQLRTLDKETNRALPSRPENYWSGDVTWKEGAFSWMTSVRGQNRSRPQTYVAGTEGFKVVDTTLGWRQGPTRASLRINNLLNSWYQEVAGYNTPARNYLLNVDYTL